MITRTDSVYEFIITRMLSGTLRPGDLVDRRALAKTLNVSISPVNEAILQLELEGMLETIPRKGTRIRVPTQRDVWGLLMTRMAIETQAIRMCCGERIRKQQSRLSELAHRVDVAPATAELLFADAAFHRALVKLADCPTVLWHFDRLMRQSLILLRTPAAINTRDNHVRLTEALCTEDPEKAAKVLRKHLQSGKEALSLERFEYQNSSRMRFGESPQLPQQRLVRSMEKLLGSPPPTPKVPVSN